MKTKLICIDDRWIGDKIAPRPSFSQRVTAVRVHHHSECVYYELQGFPDWIYEVKGFVRRRGPCEKRMVRARKALQTSMDFVF
jgi:hypothetical protein